VDAGPVMFAGFKMRKRDSASNTNGISPHDASHNETNSWIYDPYLL